MFVHRVDFTFPYSLCEIPLDFVYYGSEDVNGFLRKKFSGYNSSCHFYYELFGGRFKQSFTKKKKHLKEVFRQSDNKLNSILKCKEENRGAIYDLSRMLRLELCYYITDEEFQALFFLFPIQKKKKGREQNCIYSKYKDTQSQAVIYDIDLKASGKYGKKKIEFRLCNDYLATDIVSKYDLQQNDMDLQVYFAKKMKKILKDALKKNWEKRTFLKKKKNKTSFEKNQLTILNAAFKKLSQYNLNSLEDFVESFLEVKFKQDYEG